ncbi:MAG: hypothetical protein HYR63_19965 [Proteobacteria bacterium]|nr:hypothetical protein [Pseudomonadota bacterium]
MPSPAIVTACGQALAELCEVIAPSLSELLPCRPLGRWLEGRAQRARFLPAGFDLHQGGADAIG